MTDLEMRKVLNIKKLRHAGIIPNYIDCGRKKQKQSAIDFEKVPFSNYFNTYAEFLKAHDKLLDDASEGKDLDDNEIDKISKTIKELGISI